MSTQAQPEPFFVDVSEVKTKRDCSKKWVYSSRHKYHLRPKATPPAFAFGTLFHEALHAMYLGTPIEKVLEMTLKEISDPVELRVMTNMINGYYDFPYQADKDRYIVLDIEHNFKMYIPEGVCGIPNFYICGSIDMITFDIETGEIWGFEHKTASKFRTQLYNKLDEQPRTYFEALQVYIVKNHERILKIAQEHGFDNFKVGGIFINQVKKVQRNFEYKRDECIYGEDDREKFVAQFLRTCKEIYDLTSDNTPVLPEPGYMKCQMCEYASICDHFGYEDAGIDEVLGEFSEEFGIREVDHLEEKVERSGSTAESAES